MKIRVRRVAKRDTYTIGRLYIDGKYFCDTIEDKDRGLNSRMPLGDIQARKVYAKTAIPTGTYRVSVTWSNAFGKPLPLLHDVPGYSGIRIHTGNTAADTAGCLIVGQNTQVGKVLNSRLVFSKLFPLIEAACKSEDGCWLTVE